MARIRVSQRNIDTGVHGSNRFCPVGNALHDAGYRITSVTAQQITFNNGARIETPKVASENIRTWDGSYPDAEEAGEMFPFTFTI